MNERLESLRLEHDGVEKRLQSLRQQEELLRKEVSTMRLESEAEKSRLDEASIPQSLITRKASGVWEC